MPDGIAAPDRIHPAAGDNGPRIIVSERSGRWAVALRRELGPGSRILETRSIAECWACLSKTPASLVVVELNAGNVDTLLGRMARREREYPRVRVAVFADRRLAGYEWLLREAGAAVFLSSPRRAAVLADLARRHLARHPVEAVETCEAILAALPWKRGENVC
jgi:hypothetical protein